MVYYHELTLWLLFLLANVYFRQNVSCMHRLKNIMKMENLTWNQLACSSGFTISFAFNWNIEFDDFLLILDTKLSYTHMTIRIIITSYLLGSHSGIWLFTWQKLSPPHLKRLQGSVHSPLKQACFTGHSLSAWHPISFKEKRIFKFLVVAFKKQCFNVKW